MMIMTKNPLFLRLHELRGDFAPNSGGGMVRSASNEGRFAAFRPDLSGGMRAKDAKVRNGTELNDGLGGVLMRRRSIPVIFSSFASSASSAAFARDPGGCEARRSRQ
jgi:hypothetical protein